MYRMSNLVFLYAQELFNSHSLEKYKITTEINSVH